MNKQTAFHYFRKQRSFQKIVANKSYAQALQSPRDKTQTYTTYPQKFATCTPPHNKVGHKKEITNTHNHKLHCIKAPKTPPTVVTGAGVKPRVSCTETSITLNNRFQIFDTFSDMYMDDDKLEDQYILGVNNDMQAHESHVDELVKMTGKHLGDTIPGLEGKPKIDSLGKKKLGFRMGIINSPSMIKISRPNSTLGSARHSQWSHRINIRPSWRL